MDEIVQFTEFVATEFVDVNNIQGEIPVIRKRRVERNWIKIKEFETPLEADVYVKEQNMWQRTSRKSTLTGEKVEFRCKLGTYRRNECPAAIYLLYHSHNMKVSLFATNCKHIHEKVTPSRGLDYSSKMFITDLYKSGIRKPNSILAAFRDQNLLEPEKFQLTNFLRTLRSGLTERNEISGVELLKWCCKKQIIPEDMDNLFVLNSIINCSSDIQNQDMRIVLSTKRLLENFKKSAMIQIDATYKLIWQGYSVIITGTSDKNNTFHPCAVLVCQNENEHDYSFIFSALKKYNSDWKPTILLADESSAVTNGFHLTFKYLNNRLTCYFHVMQAIEKKLKPIKECNEIKSDISFLQLCPDEEIFNKASQLFIQKWNTERPEIQEFLIYFEDQWLKKNRNWYEGAALGYPSTNNGIKATNVALQKEHTMRARLPPEQFFNSLESVLSKWSKDRYPLSPKYKEFSLKPTIFLKDWIEAYQWSLSKKDFLFSNNKFYLCSTKIETITTELLCKFIDKNWETFEIFKEINFSIWVVESLNDEFVCSCPTFMKNYKCKHTLGLKIRMDLINVPQEAIDVTLGKKRTRGRPIKAQRACIVPE